MWRRFIETRNGHKYELFKKERNKLKGQLRAAKRRLFKQISKDAKNNPKKFWAYVNSKRNYKEDIPELMVRNVNDNSVSVTNGISERAKVLSDFFGTTFTKDEVTDTNNINAASIMGDIKISVEDVCRKLKELNISKSPGPDNIHPRMLKELANELSRPLEIVFSQSIMEGKLPEDWKKADITAIHKKGDKHNAENYRPISLTSVCCKIAERIIRDKMEIYLESNNLLSKKQFGFMKGKSTILQLLRVLDDWTEAMDARLPVDVIYTDFQKAFDSVPHGGLLQKLTSIGINGKLHSWIQSFLTNRKQRVKIKGIVSDWVDVLSGVPQGSVLGPLLFIIYINDIVEELNCNCYLYADDMKMYKILKSEDDCCCLQKNLNNVVKWSDKWKIRLNIAKCKVLRLNGNTKLDTPLYTITVNGLTKALEITEEEKDLGVKIDSHLSFENHFADVINKANKIVGILKRNFKDLNYSSFSALYKALVRSHLEYGQSVWSPYKLKHIDALEAVQRRATKIIPSLRRLSYAERLRKLSLPTLAYRRLRGDMIELFKMVHGINKTEACPKLEFSTFIKTRGHSYKLFKRPCVSNIRKNFFTYRVVDSWNSLPNEVVTAPSINSFKNRLDRHWSCQDIVFNYRSVLLTAGQPDRSFLNCLL